MRNSTSRAVSGACVLAFLTGIAAAQATAGTTTFKGSNSTQIVSVIQSGKGFGIEASTPSTGGVGAIFGQATGTSGFNNGVWGRSFSTAGVAVRGENMATTGAATGGAFFSRSTKGLGVFGSVSASSGTGIGVHGFAQSPNGVGVVGDVASPCSTAC